VRTNLPQWPTEPPAPDPLGAAFLIVRLGDAPVGHWLDRIDRPCTVLSAPGEAEIAAFVGAASVGLRVLITGPERDVLRARAAALGAGAVAAEITCFATRTDVVDVWCAACRQSSTAPVDGPGACPHCGTVVTVEPHHSPRLAARLGVLSEADERGLGG
jgi:dimethylamine monooxygenase subunit C